MFSIVHGIPGTFSVSPEVLHRRPRAAHLGFGKLKDHCAVLPFLLLLPAPHFVRALESVDCFRLLFTRTWFPWSVWMIQQPQKSKQIETLRWTSWYAMSQWAITSKQYQSPSYNFIALGVFQRDHALAWLYIHHSDSLFNPRVPFVDLEKLHARVVDPSKESWFAKR